MANPWTLCWEQAGLPHTPAALGQAALPAASPASSDSQSVAGKAWRGLKGEKEQEHIAAGHWPERTAGTESPRLSVCFIPSLEQCPSGVGMESQLP